MYSEFNGNAYTVLRLLSGNRTGLQICHINAQSLVYKMDKFKKIFEKSGVDVIFVTETWFRLDMPDSLFKANDTHYSELID